MSLLRQLIRGVRTLVNRPAADREIADEVDHFLAEARADLESRGLAPGEARRQARLRFGDAVAVREQVRAYGWENRVESFVLDTRHAVRRLARSPGFTIVTVLTLALGMGAATAILSVVNAVLLRPLPYPQPENIVLIDDRAADSAPVDVTFGSFREIEERSRVLAAAAVSRPWQPTVTGEQEPERLDGLRVSARYFDVLGIPPEGPGFDRTDDRASGPAVVVLSSILWRQRFGADSAIVGRQIRLDEQLYTVVGVMPPDFEDVLLPSARVWSLLQYDATLPSHAGREWGHHLRMVGRMNAGANTAALRAELDAIAGQRVAGFDRPAWASLENGLLVRQLRDAVTGGVRPTLLAVLGAALVLLLIACVNVIHLQLANGSRRSAEFALRAALGAGAGRIVRQLVTETVLLTLMGGLAGFAVAALCVRALVALAPEGLPRIDSIGLDGASFAFALALASVVAICVGVAPARAARRSAGGGLRRESPRTTGGRHAVRRALVIAEIALALVLLVSAGLLLRSVQRIFAAPSGFDAAGVVVMQVQTSGRHLESDGARQAFFTRALAAVRATPGVEAAALTSQLPLSGEQDRYGVRLADAEEDPRLQDGGAFRYTVTPGYFDALGIPLRRGRLLDERDGPGAAPAVVVSESLARRAFGGRDPIGQRVHIGRTDLPAFTIVGVVGDVKQASLAAGPADAVYTTPAQMYVSDRALWLVVRVRGDAAALVPALRGAIRSVDPDQPIVRVAHMDRLVADSESQRRFALSAFQAFAGFALVLAVIGIFGVVSASVTDRTREIGVRTALGATRVRILGLVLGEGMGMAATGAVLGLAASLVVTRAVASLLFGVKPYDPVTYLAVGAVLAVAALVACCIPALRAVRVEPAVTLRSD